MAKNFIERFGFIKEKDVSIKVEESVQAKLKDLIRDMKGGFFVDKFAQSVFSDSLFNLHEEKHACKVAVRGNSWLESSVNNLLNIILGYERGVESPDKVFENYVNFYFVPLSGFRKAEEDAIKDAIITGDGFIEVVETSHGNFRYYAIEDAENMYIDWDYEANKVKRYVLKVEDVFVDESLNIGKFTVMQPYGEVVIRGVEFSPSQIIHYTFGKSQPGGYGRSPIATGLKDVECLKIMERSVAVISKYKAVPKVILSPEDNSPQGVLSQRDIDLINGQLTEAGDTKTPIIGKKLSVLDVGHFRKDINLTDYLDYFKRKIGILLSPDFLMFGDVTNRATGREQKQLWLLSVWSMRKGFAEVSTEALFKGISRQLNNINGRLERFAEFSDYNLKKYKKALSGLRQKGFSVASNYKLVMKTFDYVYGEFDVELTEEKNKRLLDEWRNSLITRAEYREEMGYVIDEEGSDDVFFSDLRSSEQDRVLGEFGDLMNKEDE